jgi:copper chaperone
MLELKVNDMTCGHCVSAVTRAVQSVDPQAAVQVDLQGGRVRIDGRSSVGELIKALGAAGYTADIAEAQSAATPKQRACCGGH